MSDHSHISRSAADGREQANLLRALTSTDAQARAVVSRTRRVVLGTILEQEERKQSRRRKVGVMLMACLLFVTLLAPALWNSVESFAAGGHFLDLQIQCALFGVMLFPGLVAAAVAGFMWLRAQHREPF